MQLFDSHCHLQDDRIVADLDGVMLRASNATVAGFLCCSCTESDWHRVEKIATDYPQVIPAFGIHPWYVSNVSSSWLENLREMLIRFPQAAVGEIGLDHALCASNEKQQYEVFCAELQLAQELNRPVSIHCRKAWQPLFEALDAAHFCGRGAIHSFSGSIEVAERLIKRGLAISFSGSVTSEKNRRVREVAQWIDPSMMLIESDAPDIVPAGVQSTINEPANVQLVVNALAEIKSMSAKEVARMTFVNAKSIFGRSRVTSDSSDQAF